MKTWEKSIQEVGNDNTILRLKFDHLHIRVPEDWLETLFDMFGISLLVTYGIHLYAFWTRETGGLLCQARNWNLLFWDIKKDFIEQKDTLLCSWDPCDCNQMKIFIGKWFILSLCLTFSAWLENVCNALVCGALSSDNHMVCFRRKAFLKSDKAY